MYYLFLFFRTETLSRRRRCHFYGGRLFRARIGDGHHRRVLRQGRHRSEYRGSHCNPLIKPYTLCCCSLNIANRELHK